MQSIVGIFFSLAAGIFIDYWNNYILKKSYMHIHIFFFAGFLTGMLGLYFLSQTPEPRMVIMQEKINFAKVAYAAFQGCQF